MTTDPLAALDRLVASLHAHLAAAQQRRGDDDPNVGAAYDTLADAFETYDDALFAAYGETTPLELYDDEDDLDDDDEDEDADADDADLDDPDLDDEDDDDEDDLGADDLVDLEPNDFDDHVQEDLDDANL